MLIFLALTTTVLLAEPIGSWLSGSLALLADAGHMFTDVVGISLAILAVTFAAWPASEARTFGYYRSHLRRGHHLPHRMAAVLVALMILPRTWTLLREAIDILLQAVPKGMDLAAIRQHILDTPGVRDAHDLHVWTLTSGMPVLSVHVVVDDTTLDADAGRTVLLSLRDCLAIHFDMEHCTVQLEPTSHAAEEGSTHR